MQENRPEATRVLGDGWFHGCKLLSTPDVLNAEQVAEARRLLDTDEWVDGRITAGHQSGKGKENLQLWENVPRAASARRFDPRRSQRQAA